MREWVKEYQMTFLLREWSLYKAWEAFYMLSPYELPLLIFKMNKWKFTNELQYFIQCGHSPLIYNKNKILINQLNLIISWYKNIIITFIMNNFIIKQMYINLN